MATTIPNQLEVLSPVKTAGVVPASDARGAAPEDLLARLAELEQRVARLEPRTVSNRATIVLFSGDMDKVMAALVIATGAATMGMEVSLFCTFWGLMALRRGRKLEGKGVLEKALQLMTPAGIREMSPSRLSFGGAGAKIFRKLMRDKNVQSPEELFELAREMGVKLLACQMSMDVMGIGEDELIEGVPVAGVAAYLADAADSKVTLFI
jgi:peroxiredoxin family protein